MTTIAYRDGVLAADTWARSGWTRAGDVTKIVQVGAVLAGACGSGAICKAFLDWVRRGCVGLPDMGPSDDKEGVRSGTGVLVLPDDGIVQFDPGVPPMLLRPPFLAMGSGGPIALGAMAVGASAEAAVGAALIWDGGSGGHVVVLQRPRCDTKTHAKTTP